MKHLKSLELDVLFGFLAVQLDFLTPEQLSDAMSEVIRDKTQRVGDVLVRRNVITADDHKILDALIERHLSHHGDDPTRGLERFASDTVVRDKLHDLQDDELDASLFPSGGGGSEVDQTTVTFEMGTSSSNAGRYRVLRPHAKGGLGEVMVARDAELKREVALKRIQPEYVDHPQSRSRFMLEAEITGGLEHPGIVPVYGLGNDAAGSPFYTMRLIRGRTLNDAIKEFHQRMRRGDYSPTDRTLEFRRLLGSLVAACEAVAYAHSRGVLHRDLKPANVMLGKYGETLVVDWGLAKVVGTGKVDTPDGERTLYPSGDLKPEATSAGTAMGTPVFMSPEQAAGRIGELDERTDVYSLGATLYVLLTGQSPFDNKAADLLQKVQRGEFAPPQLVQSGLPKPLVSICTKAMQRRPEDRYGGAKELAEDVERWLADQPVAAHPESLFERASRVYRQYRVTVFVASLLLLLSTTGLLVANSTIRRKNTLLVAANATAEQNFARAEEEKVRAEGNARRASQLAMRLLDTDEDLSNRPESLGTRLELTDSAATLFHHLAQQYPGDLELRRMEAQSLRSHAHLLKGTNLESEAEPVFLRAIDLYQGLVDDAEIGQSARCELVTVLLDYVVLLRFGNRLSDAEDQLERAESVLVSITDQGSWDFQRARAGCLEERGCLSFERAQSENAANMYRAAADIYRSLIDENNSLYKQDTALFLFSVYYHANALVTLGEFEQALRAFDEGLKVSKTLGNDRDHRHAHLLVLLGYGKLRLRLDSRDQQGEDSLRLAIGQWKTLAQQHPNFRLYQQFLSEARLALANGVMDQARLDEATELVEEAEVELQAVLEASDFVDFKASMVKALETKSRLASLRGRRDNAVAMLKQAISLQMEVSSAKSNSTVEQQRLDKLRSQWGDLMQEQSGPPAPSPADGPS